MMHYAKAAAISIVVIAVVFRVRALRNAIAGVA
jgi:hypothetical protein